MSSMHLRRATANEAVEVFCDAFAEYPVMRYVLGASPDYADRLRELVTLTVMGRVLGNDPLLAIDCDGRAVACATLTEPGSTATTEPGDVTSAADLDELAERTWQLLGADGRDRHRVFFDAVNTVGVEQPNVHVNMIGVVGPYLGQGLARLLLNEVHARSAAHSESEGVSLTTEFPANVSLYEHFGYEIVGHVQVDEGLETWGFFRRDQAERPS
jgi:GNAT superfamily N-acetyltransferase